MDGRADARRVVNDDLWLANSNLCLKISDSAGLLRRQSWPTLPRHERPVHSAWTSTDDHRQAPPAWRREGRCRRERSDEAAAPSRQPLSHPFVERLIGTLRREFVDRTLFWNARDLERKLGEFKEYYNGHRVHASLGGGTPAEAAGVWARRRVDPQRFRSRAHCRGLYELPMAA